MNQARKSPVGAGLSSNTSGRNGIVTKYNVNTRIRKDKLDRLPSLAEVAK